MFTKDQIHGSSPYGPVCFAGSDGSLAPNKADLEIAHHHGKRFAGIISQYVNGKQ